MAANRHTSWRVAAAVPLAWMLVILSCHLEAEAAAVRESLFMLCDAIECAKELVGFMHGALNHWHKFTA